MSRIALLVSASEEPEADFSEILLRAPTRELFLCASSVNRPVASVERLSGCLAFFQRPFTLVEMYTDRGVFFSRLRELDTWVQEHPAHAVIVVPRSWNESGRVRIPDMTCTPCVMELERETLKVLKGGKT
jgi:hypothetical protein